MKTLVLRFITGLLFPALHLRAFLLFGNMRKTPRVFIEIAPRAGSDVER